MVATIVIARESRFRDKARSYKVKIDGVAVGRIRNGSIVEFPVAPGTRQVQLAIDWCRSPAVLVEVLPDGRYRFNSRPGGSPFMTPIHALFRPGRYLSLEPFD